MKTQKKRLWAALISAAMFVSMLSAASAASAGAAASAGSGGEAARLLSEAASTRSAQDNLLRMWYTAPPSKLTGSNTTDSWWQAETLPLGNGTMGGLVFGGISKDRLHFNEKSMWTGGPGSLQATINFPSSDNALYAPLAYNGGNRVTPATKASLDAYRSVLDDKSAYVWGENFTGSANSGIMAAAFGSSSANPSTQMSRWQDFGDIFLTFPGITDTAATNYLRELDMRTAVSAVSFEHNGVSYSREYFVSHPDNVMVVNLTASEAGALTFDVSTALADADLNVAANTNRSFSIEDGDTIVMDGSFKLPTRGTTGTYALNGLQFAYRLKVINSGGTLTPNASTITVNGADSVTLIFACGTDYKNEYPAYRTGVAPYQALKDRVDAAASRSYAELKARHIADHSELFGRVEMDLGGSVPTIPTDQLVASYGRSMIPEQPYVNVVPSGASYVTASGRQSSTYTHGLVNDKNTGTIWISDSVRNPWVEINLGGSKDIDLIQLACVTPGYIVEYYDGAAWEAINVSDEKIDLENEFENVLLTIEQITAEKLRVRWDSTRVGLGNRGLLNRTLGEIKAYDTAQSASIAHIATPEEQRALEVMAYQYGRYLTIAGSRQGGLPTNLGGAWLIGSSSGLWGSDYHFNINVEMNYWPALASNLAESAIVLNEYVESLREPGRVTAAQTAGVVSGPGEANGFLVNTQNNIFGYTAPSGSQEYGWNVSGSTWALINVYDYYLFTGDKEYLRDTIYPMMKEMAGFWEKFLWESPYQNGRLVVSPSVSAEQGPTVNGATYDQSFVWQHFENIIQAAQILGVDSDKLDRWRDIQTRLAPIQIGSDGQIKEWYEETSIGKAQAGTLAEVSVPNWRAGISPTNSIVPHRHISHLVGLYPGTLISKDSDQTVIDAAMVSLTERGFGATSWSKGHKINAWARMGKGAESYYMLRSMVGGGNAGLLSNLFASHGNNGGGTINYSSSRIFQIDGNFGLAAGVAEMLLQSQLGYVQFLPAIPEEWSTGSVSGLVARGNFVIDMAWADGAAENFRVLSRNGGTFTGEYAGLSKCHVTDSSGKKVSYSTLSDDKISFVTEKDETYTIRIEASGGNTAGVSVGNSYTVSFNSNGGGGVTSASVEHGKTVAAPATPARDGYTFTGWYTDAACTQRYDFSAAVTKDLTLYAGWSEKDYFGDDNGHWAERYINALAAHNYVSGTDSGIYAPDATLTRAEIMQIMYNAFAGGSVSSPAAPFEDVGRSAWYAGAVNWGYANGLITGYSETRFAPNQAVSREQLSAIFSRAAKSFNITFPSNIARASFADDAKIAAYAKAAVYEMQQAGIIEGKGGNIFDPQGTATRGEAAKVMYFVLQYAGKL